VASNDTFVLVDVSDPTTPNKKIQQQNLFLIPDGSAGTPGLRFLSDTNVGVFRPTTDTLAIATGGSERLRIDSSGRLGLGTSTPSTNLDIVVGSGTATQKLGSGSVAGGSYLNLHGASASKTWFVGANYNFAGVLEFTQSTANGGTTPSSTPAMVLSAAGNVGIGTTSPNYVLDVAGTGSISAAFTSTDSENYIALKDSGTTLGHVRVGSISNELTFRAGNSERARIDSSGRLGLGTSSPSSEFHTVGGSLYSAIKTGSTVYIGNTGTGIHGRFGVVDSSGFGIQTAWTGDNNGYNLLLNPYGGKVGIGTTSPSAKLHVATAGNNYIVSHNTTGSTSALLLGAESGSTALYSWTTVGGSTGVPLKFVTGASEAMRLDTSGRLLVGTSSAPPAATSLAANLGKADTSGAITSTSIGESHRIFHGFVPASTSTAKTTTATFQFATAYGAALIEIDIVGGLAQVSIGRYLLMVDCDTASGQTAQLTGGSSISAVLSSGWNAPVFTSSGASSTPTFTVAFTRATGVDTEDWTSWLKFTAKITSNNSSAVCTLTTLATS